MMDASELQKLIELMNDNDLLELELEEEGKKVRLKKKPPKGESSAPPVVVAQPAAMPMPMHMQVPTEVPAAGAAPAATESGESAPPSNAVTIKSPMVGTFYRSSSPDSDAFVDVGSEVDAETVTCIIEAMKVMNEIKAEVSGKIVEILVQNGEPVEFGQPLFAVEPQ